MKLAIFAITKHGIGIARRLKDRLPHADVHVPRKFEADAPAGSLVYDVLLSKLIGEVFHSYDTIVFVISLGAVVRMIAPHLRDKHVDPAVLVIDDKAKFVISVLSGHVGGANEETEHVASILGAQPVITTASDVGKTIPVDILGRHLGWTLEGEENVTRVSASVVNEEPIAFVQETGERNWWTRDVPVPGYIRRFDAISEVQDLAAFRAFLVVTDRTNGLPEAIRDRQVIYRPKSLVCGIGCNRNTAQAEIRENLETAFRDAGLSLASLRNFASIDRKADEEGFLGLAKAMNVPFVFYGKDDLAAVATPNPSETVEKFVGTPGVAEPAAMLSAGSKELIVTKRKFPNVTIAVARIPFS